MEYILRHFHKAGVVSWLYAIALFHAFHFFGIHYLDSSFLEQFLTQSEVGLLYATSSLLSLIVLASSVIFLTKIGNYYTALSATTLNLLASLGLATITNVGWLFVLFVIHAISMSVTIFCLDVFMENYTKDENTTGSVRGVFLFMAVLASLFSPYISGTLVGAPVNYDNAYLMSALYLIPVIVLLVARFRTFNDPPYKVLSLVTMWQVLCTNKNIFHISSAQFLLRFFFSWMVIYLPIYLHIRIGFSWTEIGIILFIMLVPYLLLEVPAGIIADKWLGEKELLLTGFVVTAFSTAFLFFLNSESVFVWGGALFATRIGVALIEIMNETYFFKQIDGNDTSILSIFHMLRPLAYAVGPFTAGLLLLAFDIQYLWLILGGIMFLGVYHSYALVDTR
ncbi:TPA: hypothetical protein DEP58_02855 [Patescibacteria group bacterium]|nr:MAG: hypothetical protein UU98_C0027G0002 [Parcubacteria group bacterium GW2011_GWD2_42_14]HCC05222.1 hypothetical protein [Patescibacteria group bacterium]